MVLARYAFALLALLFFFPSGASAIPPYAKKYSAPCSLCHGAWPRLNRVGWQFKVNGYQLPDGYDGAKADKVSPSFDLHLDIGNANPPLGIRYDGGISIIQPKSGPGGDQSSGFACCTEGNSLRLYASGTVTANAGYFMAYKMGDSQVDTAYIRFVNLFGQGYMGVDLGAFNTADWDLISPRREWFGLPDPALFGNGSLWAGNRGVSLGATHTGLRLYGNPGYGMFSYDLVYVSGSANPGTASNSRSKAMSAMGRLNLKDFSASFRYWNSETAELSFRRVSSGIFAANTEGTGAFTPDPLKSDESTQDYYFNLKYEAEKWEAEFAYDHNYFKLAQRSSGIETYAPDAIKRTGFSLGAIYKFSSAALFGARYGVSNTAGYKETYNGATTDVPKANVAQLEFKFELSPVQNAKISIEAVFDRSDGESRKAVDKNGNLFSYNQQNRLFLLWDWAI